MQVSPISNITSKGQITIPSRLRSQLNLKPGDGVAFELDKNVIKIKPAKKPLRDIFQSVPKLKKNLSFKQMRDIAIKEKLNGVR